MAVTLDLSTFYRETGQAKLTELEAYLRRAEDEVPRGSDAVLTGAAPVWLYLKVAHHLHGRVRILRYRDGIGNEIEIFNHNPH